MTPIIDDIMAGLAAVLGWEPLPWILLVVALITRPPLLREIALARKTGHGQSYRHLLNVTLFRAELAKRRKSADVPRAEIQL